MGLFCCCRLASASGMMREDNLVAHQVQHGQADYLLRAAHIGHDKIGRQRVEPSGDTLHRTVEALQINGDVGPVLAGQWWILTNILLAKIQN